MPIYFVAADSADCLCRESVVSREMGAVSFYISMRVVSCPRAPHHHHLTTEAESNAGESDGMGWDVKGCCSCRLCLPMRSFQPCSRVRRWAIYPKVLSSSPKTLPLNPNLELLLLLSVSLKSGRRREALGADSLGGRRIGLFGDSIWRRELKADCEQWSNTSRTTVSSTIAVGQSGV